MGAALAASMRDVTFDDEAEAGVRAQLTARQIAAWFADTTEAIGSRDLRLINNTKLRRRVRIDDMSG